MTDRTAYKTRKEYKWAKKNDKKQHARDTAYWRYPAALAFAIAWVISHNIVVGLIVGAVVGVLCVYKMHQVNARRPAFPPAPDDREES